MRWIRPAAGGRRNRQGRLVEQHLGYPNWRRELGQWGKQLQRVRPELEQDCSAHLHETGGIGKPRTQQRRPDLLFRAKIPFWRRFAAEWAVEDLQDSFAA